MRLLVAEDDPRLRELLERGLGRAGYVLDAAGRGDDALDMLCFGDYAAAIIDWRMPGLDGAAVITQARKRGVRTPFLMLTARDDPADRIAGLDAGSDDYMVKPFDFDELLARIRALLRRRPDAPEPLRFGSLVIERERRQARVGGISLALTPTELALVELLVQRAPDAVPRRDLVAAGWPDAAGDVRANVVEVHIARLRAKLAPSSFGIEAQRRGHYRLVQR